MNNYVKNGYENRKEYLVSLADDFGMDRQTVFFIADLLGESEDFDGLISSLQDYEYDMDF